MDYEHLRNELVSCHSSLSRRLQQINRFAMSHPNDMALETIVVIAERAEVPPSSLIRFAKSFGFSGFSEMQKVFQQGLVDSTSDYRQRVHTMNLQISRQTEAAQSNLDHFINGGIDALHKLRESVTDQEIENAAALLSKANVVHVAAQRRSFPIAAYLTYALSHLGVPNMLLDSLGGMFAEQGKTVREGDVLLAVSFSPYASEVLKLVEVVHARDVPVIVITDSILSPLAALADVCLEVKETEVFGFRGLVLSALMCLSLSLIVELGRQMEQPPPGPVP
ncbi:MAG: MurR/RpiR family transcriptional regulator [SAR324 cluster bacterium]|nr:MurR/RpiR family transcriptional regulator [SAR324 cluster bacterium]